MLSNHARRFIEMYWCYIVEVVAPGNSKDESMMYNLLATGKGSYTTLAQGILPLGEDTHEKLMSYFSYTLLSLPGI